MRTMQNKKLVFLALLINQNNGQGKSLIFTRLLFQLKMVTVMFLEYTSSRIGFRTVEIKDGQLKVNGKAILVKGVNLHEFDEVTGQVIDEELMRKDLEQMKKLNINAVRTSHYPQPELWYKLCDEYGMYLVGEGKH